MRLLLIILGFVLTLNVSADQIIGRVVGITDGDTITVLDEAKTQYKIRLAGIDAPEKKQPFGQKSKEHLSDKVFGKDVTIEWDKKDRYGRIVGKVLVNRDDANLAQVEAGLAWWYRKYAKEQSQADQKLYEQAEEDAVSAKRGLWSDPTSIPPWEFRHVK